MKKRYHSIANDRTHMITGEKPLENFYTCEVGAGGLVSNERRVLISIDTTKEGGIRIDEIDDLSRHSNIDQNPLTEWASVTVAYLPKRNRPFRFYFRKNPEHIRGAIAQLQIIPDLKNHKRSEEYTASWKILTRMSSIFPGKISEEQIRGLLSSETMRKACASQLSRYLRLNSVKSKNYTVELSPVVSAEHYQVISKQ
jgi:hypothetical protein